MNKKCKSILLSQVWLNRSLYLSFSVLMFMFAFVPVLAFAGITGPEENNLITSQPIKITGIVTDASNGEALIGATVSIKGTTSGVVTDVNGKFSIDVPTSEAILVISFIGYKPLQIPAAGEKMLDIKLTPEMSELQEFVVVGYGTVKKRDLTGSVSSVKSSEITKTASNNPLQSMQGKVAGMDVMKTGGQSGAELSFNLRGNRSINASNNPLILVDGIPYGSVLDINASDIASIDILKDASSTAIYGTRGANGVIIITTKKAQIGQVEKSKVSFNSWFSFNSPTDLPPVMSAQQEYLVLAERARYTDEAQTGNWGSTSLSDPKYSAESLLPAEVSAPYTKSVYQMYQEGGVQALPMVIHNSNTQNYELALSGANKKTSYDLSVGYLNEKGILLNDELKRYNFRVNLNHKISDKLSTGANIQYTFRDWDRREDDIYYSAISTMTLSQLYLPDGTLLDKPCPLSQSTTNPLFNELPGYYQNNTKGGRLFANGFLEWEIVKNLRFKSVLAIDNQTSRQGTYIDYKTFDMFRLSKGTFKSVDNIAQNGYTFENTLNYSLTKGVHNFNLLAGQSANQYVLESHGVSGNGPMEHDLISSFYSMSFVPPANLITNDVYVKTNMLSFFGRVNYKLMDRYLVTATLRSDGSSVLAPGHQWNSFPSVAGAWVVSEEPFLKSAKSIDNLKLRLSWGKAGNAAVNPYQTLTRLSDQMVPNPFGNQVIYGRLPGLLGNQNLTWETTSTYDLGIDISIFKQRVSATLDYYYANTYSLLLYAGLPGTSVYPQTMQNVGNTNNQGVEAIVIVRAIEQKDFNWTSSLTFALNRDQIVSLASGQTSEVSNPNAALIVGQPVRAFYDYEATGCWKINDPDQSKYKDFGTPLLPGTPGSIKIADLNGDSLITGDDRRVYNKSPKYILGWNNTVGYKNFSLTIQAYARVGQWIQYGLNNLYVPVNAGAQPILDSWTPENQNAKFPRQGIAPSSYYTSLQYELASFVKINNVTLSYTAPKNLLSKFGISSLRIYSTVQNYFTFSNLNNYDPERGGDIANPLLKQVVFGMNLEF